MDNSSKKIRTSKWHLINIKARREQNYEHYTEVFDKMFLLNPSVSLAGEHTAKMRQLTKFEVSPSELVLKLSVISYVVVDPDAFYDIERQEDVRYEDWDENIVSNKRETDVYFVPSSHTAAVRCNSKITLNSVVTYLSKALDEVEPEGFDVDVIKHPDVIRRIMDAYAIIDIRADISYSNPGHTRGFQSAFETSLKESGASRVEIHAKGDKDFPLRNKEDGLVPALLNISEKNGHVKASILEEEGGKVEVINTDDYPRKVVLPSTIEKYLYRLIDLLKGI